MGDDEEQRAADANEAVELKAAAEGVVEAEAEQKRVDELQASLVRSQRVGLSEGEVKHLVEKACERFPRVYAVLQRDGLHGHQLNVRMLQISQLQYTEDALLSLLGEKPANDSQALVVVEEPHPVWRRRLEITRHSVIRGLAKEGLGWRIANLIGWGSAIVGPSLAKGFTWASGFGIVLVVCLRLRAQWKDLDHKSQPILDRNQRQRQLKLESLLDRTQRWALRKPRRKMNKEEKFDFRRDTLELINSHVRDHRADTEGTQIYTNLLVRRGDGVYVIARSDLVRRVPELYTADECSLAWKTLTTGAPNYSGNIYKDAPATRENKPYKSVLVLPIKQGDRIVGVVSIDSTGMYHFDSVFAELHAELAPYVQLLAITLTEDHDTT